MLQGTFLEINVNNTLKFKNYLMMTSAALISSEALVTSYDAETRVAVINGLEAKSNHEPEKGDYILQKMDGAFFVMPAADFESRYSEVTPSMNFDGVAIPAVFEPQQPEPEQTQTPANFIIETHEHGGGDFEMLLPDLTSSAAGILNVPIAVTENDVAALAKTHADLIETAMIAKGHDVRVTPILCADTVTHVVARENGYAAVMVDIVADEAGEVFFGANPDAAAL